MEEWGRCLRGVLIDGVWYKVLEVVGYGGIPREIEKGLERDFERG